jgi:hypothetical protein
MLLLIFAAAAAFKELYYEAAIIGLIGLTSCAYHLTASATAELVDMSAILLTAPILMYLCIRAGNYIPLLCGAVAGAVFMENRKDLCWVKHFYGLHIPAAIAFGSMLVLH